MDAIYARQSVDKADSISIESQIDYCKYETRGNPYIVFYDRGYSGKNTDRPEFQRMLQQIRLGKIDRVLCYKLDRCSRSILDFASLMHELERNGVEFISCTEKFDTSTPMGRAMLNICIVFAQLERETIQQRVYDAYHSRNIKGFYMGGRVPFGYRLAPFWIGGKKTACYKAEPSEAKIVQTIFDVYGKQHTSLGDVVNVLHNTGSDLLWTRTKISRILSNPIYVKADEMIYEFYQENGAKIHNERFDFIGENGCYYYNKNKASGELVLAPHKGIVSSKLWLQCRNKLKSNLSNPATNKNINSFLVGKIKCLHCGYAVTVAKTKGKNAEYRYLLCSMANKSRGVCTGIHGIKADVIEMIVSIEIQMKIKKLGETLQWERLSNEDKMRILNLLIEKIEISESEMIIHWKV